MKNWFKTNTDSSPKDKKWWKPNISWLKLDKWVKTTAQMVALAWLLWRPNIWVEYAGIALFFVAAVLTLWSMLQYLSAARADLLDQ